ncbi:tetraprenyl-beta-curcumene synthase family protein [Herbivorax sp. ANBcel31]|uniref:tetraprenyl-beta-curcumene synthase family protein n=1 Tax=Herbivorax sp. ANBcel31 TaxID=3069754 RepID=UPI0027B25DA2|nr:tetraprenyl-beta-curcumene synthase family protein [Herbivorax sp. ANBcel31]MDQ2085327.1 tetraprenyl-beta-curcumene synthase family protein [Herbivorax sp. ANBcel31]
MFPKVKKNLDGYKNHLSKFNDNELKKQALSSIHTKSFHCIGGSIYALYPDVDFNSTLKFICAFQTISDYLDNLCDKTKTSDESAFRHLHLSMYDAIEISSFLSDYYKYYPFKQDNNYLHYLVTECKSSLSKLYSYKEALPFIKKYVDWYSNLQTYKHLDTNVREMYLKNWAKTYLKDYPLISLWEFSAATGSTLGIFAMYAASHNPLFKNEDFLAIDKAYFPWICGLHILLDYYIDYMEDLEEKQLNFTSYYKDLKMCEDRIIFFTKESLKMCNTLKYPLFHKTVVKGLLAMYLSDSKAFEKHNKKSSINIVKHGGCDTIFYHKICKTLRVFKLL